MYRLFGKELLNHIVTVGIDSRLVGGVFDEKGGKTLLVLDEERKCVVLGG